NKPRWKQRGFYCLYVSLYQSGKLTGQLNPISFAHGFQPTSAFQKSIPCVTYLLDNIVVVSKRLLR
ncbi:hypothetical protein ACSL9C_003907, partial [Vibrio navarrensis]